MASLLTNSAVVTGRRSDIYVAAVPLRAMDGPAQSVMSAAYSLNVWDFQHFMVIIKPLPPPPPPDVQAFVFDFQPKDPENIYAAVAVLSGRPIPGVVLMRKLTKLPRRKCWLIGSFQGDAVEISCKFNNAWETDLRVGNHDCRDYTNGLVERITGEKYVLDRLRRSADT